MGSLGCGLLDLQSRVRGKVGGLITSHRPPEQERSDLVQGGVCEVMAHTFTGLSSKWGSRGHLLYDPTYYSPPEVRRGWGWIMMAPVYTRSTYYPIEERDGGGPIYVSLVSRPLQLSDSTNYRSGGLVESVGPIYTIRLSIYCLLCYIRPKYIRNVILHE